MAWLLDTNILSELRRSKPEPKVLSFIETLPLEHTFVSVATLAELRYGIEIITDAPRRADLKDWLTNIIRPMFDQRVIPITEDIMLKWRLLEQILT